MNLSRRTDSGFKGEAAGVPHEIGATLALLIHELGTNSLKYGALSVPEGTVAITWAKEGETVALDWQEHNGPKVLPPSRNGFGSRLMQTAFAPGRGEATIAFEESRRALPDLFSASRRLRPIAPLMAQKFAALPFTLTSH